MNKFQSALEMIQVSKKQGHKKKKYDAPRLRAMPNVLQSSAPPNTNWRPLFRLSDKANAKKAQTHFAEFVGYRGRKTKFGVELDPKGPVHRGQAFPPPINKEGKYLGILWYEMITFLLLFLNIEVMLKWAREHGKTFMATWFIEWSMIYCGKIWLDKDGKPSLDDQGKETIVPESWLYFSVTKIKAKVGYWVFRWAKKFNLIVKASKGAKQNTYTNFELTNGAMMQIHDFMTEDPIGEHNWNFALDDVVKKRWQDFPKQCQRARDQWDILNYIGHVRVFIFGTRKFLGDPLEYLESVLSDLVVDIRPPFVMDGVFPHWTPKIDPKTNMEILIAPELHTHQELYKKRDASKKAWMSEQMQDPQAFGVKVWSRVNYVNALLTPFVKHYDLLFIYLDRATTTNKTSDYTGCVIGIREIAKYDEEGGNKIQRRIVIDDWTDKWVKEHLLYKVNELVREWRAKYPHLQILLVIEKQGGGDDFESDIIHRSQFELIEEDENTGDVISIKRVDNILREHNRIMVHSTGKKHKRIENRLETPIKNKETGIIFLNALRNSILVKQILNYPNNDKVDAIDALAIGDYELMNTYEDIGANYYDDVKEIYRKYETGKLDTQLAENNPSGWLDGILDGVNKRKNKTVF